MPTGPPGYLQKLPLGIACPGKKTQLAVFLLMTVFAQTLFPFVRGHFMAFAFFSAGHGLYRCLLG